MHAVRWLVLFLAVLLQPLGAAHAQSSKELLIPVDAATIARVESASKYELRSQAYFAKRYRIVRVNFDVLKHPDAEFTISAFPDVTFGVKALQTHGPSSSDQLQEWTGVLVSPATRMIAVDTGAEIPPPRVHLWVRSGAHEVPLRVVRDIAQSEGKGGAATSFGPLPDISGAPLDDDRLTTRLNLQSLSGQWFAPSLMNEVVIQPLDGDPRYHIVFEQDRARIPQSADTSSEDTRRKLERRQQFIQALERERAAERARANP